MNSKMLKFFKTVQTSISTLSTFISNLFCAFAEKDYSRLKANDTENTTNVGTATMGEDIINK
ncbi:ATV_HP_G0014960.mRNA.1.CDS.1 [Saccharomyces cerevisiae]|nr:ATV_HP_G0014960.mRNA.1.CDS.1 [Saccharomyces cerevisiae]CAI6949921.1 ATV_HP_G0014960.mRNA.1.CDS.1 [Saccharomyces cerevisiae]